MTNIKKKHSAEFKATVVMAAMRRIDEIYMKWPFYGATRPLSQWGTQFPQ